MECLTGGELFDRIIAKTKTGPGVFTEKDAATLIRKTLKAIEHWCVRVAAAGAAAVATVVVVVAASLGRLAVLPPLLSLSLL